MSHVRLGVGGGANCSKNRAQSGWDWRIGLETSWASRSVMKTLPLVVSLDELVHEISPERSKTAHLQPTTADTPEQISEKNPEERK